MIKKNKTRKYNYFRNISTTFVIDKIYKRFLILIKETEISFLDRDKWNPGDIWYIDDSISNTNFDQYTSVISLNRFLIEQLQRIEL